MLVIGAKGFAKEILEVLNQKNQIENLTFYDDVNDDIEDFLYGKFPVIKNLWDAQNFFINTDPKFTIGIGNPLLRRKMYFDFTQLGGEFTSTISNRSEIGNFDTEIGIGCNILSNAIISNGTKIGKGCIIYYNVIIAHDCIIGNFVELSPGATILGAAQIGKFTHVGANSTILPKIKVGDNVVIGAGAVVTKDLPDNCMAVGIPAKIIKQR